ncbi:DUF1992 domain-containing protein [Acerihabitans sp. KWT182]|uniref:DUF1992 domain-containing protein n=1 Tax=Acerihabitans sp. KWT182 TaxID=3157919 RepID=A0AAU7Q8A3_9GAMM
MWLFDERAEQHILHAQKNGEFDNLPGYGRPLQLEDDSAVPEELRTGYRLLKNSGYLPPPLQDRKDALQLKDLLHSIEENDVKRTEIAARLRLLEMKLSQAGLSTDFLHQGYQTQLQRRFSKTEV